MKKLIPGLLVFMGMVTVGFAQTNLVLNPDAEKGADSWKPWGEAKVGERADNKSAFAVRNGGYFIQIFNLDRSAEGKYALFAARGTADLISPKGSITSMPSLYGYLFSSDPDGYKINTYMTNQSLLGRPASPDDWVMMY